MVAFIILGFLGTVFLYSFYIAVMTLKRVRESLDWQEKVLAYPAVLIGLAIDVAVNVVVGSVIFFDLPRELTLTARMKRLKKGNGYRARLASSVCKRINKYDPDGPHC